MVSLINSIDSDNPLLKAFNNRDEGAFGVVYKELYNDLYYFSNSLYKNTEVDPCDVIQDIFLKIWSNGKLKFDDFYGVKGFVIIAIKNDFRKYIRHKRHVDKYNETLTASVDDYFITHIAEMETFSAITHAIDLLPSECAKVFKLYIDGWDVKEIAKKLQKAESTVYNQKNEAIRILKTRLNNKQMLVFMAIINPM